jgi:hypothetical protein
MMNKKPVRLARASREPGGRVLWTIGLLQRSPAAYAVNKVKEPYRADQENQYRTDHGALDGDSLQNGQGDKHHTHVDIHLSLMFRPILTLTSPRRHTVGKGPNRGNDNDYNQQ